MSPLLRPLHLLLMMFAASVTRHHLDVIEYLQEENRVLKARLGGRRIRFTDAERGRFARKAHALGRTALNQLQTLVTPDTLLRWYRQLVAYNRVCPTFDQLNAPAKAMIGAFLDFAGVSREAFASAWTIRPAVTKARCDFASTCCTSRRERDETGRQQ